MARLHGGKGLVSQASSSFAHGSSDQDEDYAGSEEEEDENNEDNDEYVDGMDAGFDHDDQDSYLSSNSDLAGVGSSGGDGTSTGPFRKRKMVSTARKFEKKGALAKPSLAIRVAKAAYYNSKDSLSPLQSNIFTNGGIRGGRKPCIFFC